MFLHYISKACFVLLSVVRSNFSSPIVAVSFVLGMYFGLTPALTLQWMFLAASTVVVRTNMPVILASTLFFSLLSALLEPFFDTLGLFILTQTAGFLPFWSWMYHAPLIPYTQFNHSIVMGSTTIVAITCMPVYFFAKAVFNKYGDKVDSWISSSRFYRSLSHYEQLYG